MNTSHVDFACLTGQTYYVRTFGCQMNLNDSERVSGMLDSYGAIPVATPEEASIVVFMTCCVREAADIRLFGQVSSMKNMALPAGAHKRIVCVGGCIGQRDGEYLFEKLDNLDVVFGTHTLSDLPRLIALAYLTDRKVSSLKDKTDEFSTDLPVRRKYTYSAWVPITSGCNNFCTYCIVPHVRGREKSRDFDQIIEELHALAATGTKEITLLGQNVNSYGRDRYGKPRFAELLRACADVDIERIRFITSHPKDLSLETIQAFAEVPNVMPALHLAVQSGSNKVLKAMNRRYTHEHYRSLVDQLRAYVPDVALSTDIIVGFPGETEEDFLDTLHLARDMNYAQAFTFIYSPREGTPAARLVDDTPREVIQDRFDRLVEVVKESAYANNLPFQDKIVKVLVEGTSKRDAQMLSGKSEHGQTVHACIPSHQHAESYIGEIVKVRVNEVKTWYLTGELLDD